MRIQSYTILHYGLSYLQVALKSAYPFMDRLNCFYTPHPSHGHKVDIPPIETEDELFGTAMLAIPDKLVWNTTDFWQEGQQRNYAVGKCARDGADLILVLDYDEVWHPEVLNRALSYVWNTNSAKDWLINFTHLWRSFNWVCVDDAWPVRIIDTRHNSGVAYLPRELGPIYHFGYAISDRVMRYKLSIHGHKNELRPEWYEEKWQAWPPQENCHPTNGRKDNGEGWWNPKPFDKMLLPEIMRKHPYWNLERIE